ncbi:conjugal transfer protein [Caballeronia telluris]|uniref:TrbM protein n=1 Tax=Caballeronia telluris TaxID=326475 RepID=A0A158KGI5_9BURK|nr:conjugal transfer protein [Caballeronia telluris]SAL80242.1 hypothetical protein AWB66_06211 [Caballeronia telluris]
MKRYSLAIIAASVTFSVSSPVLADPCQSLICMMGKVQGGVAGNGSVQDGCAQGISDFLSIVKTRHGHIDLTATPKARKDYLNLCPGAAGNPSDIDSIISKFGNATL